MERLFVVLPVPFDTTFEDIVIVVAQKTRGEYYVDLVPEFHERLELGAYPTFARAYKAATHEVRYIKRYAEKDDTVENFYGLDRI